MIEVTRNENDTIPTGQLQQMVRDANIPMSSRHYNRWLKGAGAKVNERTTIDGRQVRVVRGIKRSRCIVRILQTKSGDRASSSFTSPLSRISGRRDWMKRVRDWENFSHFRRPYAYQQLTIMITVGSSTLYQPVGKKCHNHHPCIQTRNWVADLGITLS